MAQGGPPVLGTGLGEFDSRDPDRDVRELVNPARCERVPDGIETRTSPRVPAGGTGARTPKAQRARSTRARDAKTSSNVQRPCLVTRLVSRLACRASESGS